MYVRMIDGTISNAVAILSHLLCFTANWFRIQRDRWFDHHHIRSVDNNLDILVYDRQQFRDNFYRLLLQMRIYWKQAKKETKNTILISERLFLYIWFKLIGLTSNYLEFDFQINRKHTNNNKKRRKKNSN